MRPPTDNDVSCITVEDNTLSLQSSTYKTVDGLHDQTSRWQFSFDKVFIESSSQQVVFDEISLLVQSALDGYRVAIFAYGQTGSGRHTQWKDLNSRKVVDGASFLVRWISSSSKYKSWRRRDGL